MKAQISLSVVLAALLCGGAALAQEPGCGSLKNGYGPFDYRTAGPDQKALVENAHFTPGVESLTRGKTGAFGGDDYTVLNLYLDVTPITIARPLYSPATASATDAVVPRYEPLAPTLP